MKALIISLTIISSIVATVVSVAIHSDRAFSRLSDTVSVSDTSSREEDLANTYKIEKEYSRLEHFLTFFASDSEIREMEMYIEDIKSAALENDRAALITAKSRLRLHIEQLRRLSAFSFEAIF